MYQKEFNQKLRQTFPKSVMFYGENEYLIEYYINLYINKLDAKETLLSLYYEAWDFAKAKAFLSQSSLFGGTNLVVVKLDKKIPKKELDVLITLGVKNSDNYFLYYYQGEAKNAKSMQTAFVEKKGGVWVRCFEANIREATALLQQKANFIKLDIDIYALQHLLVILNNNLALCAKELEKLAILNSKITSKDIDRLVYSTAPLATEKLLIELFQKKEIIQNITKLLESGEDAISLLRSTQYFINQLFLFHSYIKLNGYVDSQAILGYRLPKPIEEQKAQLVLRLKAHTFLEIFEYLLEQELLIKSSPTTQKEALIYSTLLGVQNLIKN